MTQVNTKTPSWTLKLQRAIQLQEELISEIRAYNQDFPTETKVESWDGTLLKVSLHIRKHPDEKWSVILGDVIHNYRSALDSIVFAIIEFNASLKGKSLRQNQIRNIAFPIKFKKCDLKSLDGLDEYAEEILINDLTEFQPFKYLNEFVGPNDEKVVLAGHPFAMLNELSNQDKHRKLNLVFLDLNNWAVIPLGGATFLGFRNLKPEKSWQNYLFEYEFTGGDLNSVPHFLPHFQVGIEDPSRSRPAYSLESLLGLFNSQVSYAINKLEYHLDPNFEKQSK